MYKTRGTSIFCIYIMFFFFFFFFFFLSSSMSTRGETTGMQLSREELVSLAGYGEEKLSSVLVMGSVVCEACVKPGTNLLTSQLAGAKIRVQCRTEGARRQLNWAYGTTDYYGEFMIDLPSHLHAIPNLEESCTVMMLRVPKHSPCRRGILHKTPTKLRISSVGNGIRVYTAGTMKMIQRLKPSRGCLPRAEDGSESV